MNQPKNDKLDTMRMKDIVAQLTDIIYLLCDAKEKDIMINDTIVLHKAGDVIPEVVKVLKERRTGIEIPFKMIKNCPICNSKLEKKETEANYFCPNPNCDARNIEGLIHFSSRETMNIEGFGECF